MAEFEQESIGVSAPSEEGAQGHRIWILVDHSAREQAFENVTKLLIKAGVDVQIVTITEVIGSVARDAIAGGAERLLRGLRVAMKGRGLDEDLIGAVRRIRPDMLVVTNPRFGRALGLLESLTGISSLQVGVMPDFNLSDQWTQSSLAAFLVPHDDIKARLLSLGIDEKRVFVAGPPIQEGFSRSIDREAVREEFGFVDQKIVFIRADGFGPSIVEKLVFQLTLIDEPMRFVFHHNGDAATAATLRRAAAQYGLPASMFGKVSDLSRYVAASDLVVAAPDEPLIAELVASKRPLVFVGNDEFSASQVDFLVREGVARNIADILRLGSELERFSHDENLEASVKSHERFEVTSDAAEVSESLLYILSHLEEFRFIASSRSDADNAGTRQPEAPTHDGAGEQQGNNEAIGPFESIGSGGSSSDAASHRPSDGDAASPPVVARGVSQSEAKEQLAQLILVERDLERRLSDAQRQQERWHNRLELARQWNEDTLAQEASSILRNYVDEANQLDQELVDIRRQKDKLKRLARERRFHGSGDDNTSIRYLESDISRTENSEQMERKFRQMEVDKDLESLKERLRREMGD